jgi:hypothetical protein
VATSPIDVALQAPITPAATPSRRARPRRPHTVRALWLAIVVSAATIACCVSAPAALVVVADLTLSAAVGLGVGLAIVITAYVLHGPAPLLPFETHARSALAPRASFTDPIS